MTKCLIPFSGGVRSLYLLIWALKQNWEPWLLYVPGLFEHNGSSMEQKSVKNVLKHFKDYEGNSFSKNFAIVPWIYAPRYGNHGFQSLLGLCLHMAANYKNTIVLWSESIDLDILAKWSTSGESIEVFQPSNSRVKWSSKNGSIGICQLSSS